METGTVKFFNSNTDKRFGFITPDVAGRDVFFHHNGVRQPQRSIQGFKEPGLIQTGKVRFPKQGDRIVYESESSPKGPRARLWAFEEDYKRAQLVSGIPSTDVNAPPHDGFTWKELEAVTGGIFGLMQCIPSASKELNLSNQQIGIFLRNTPDRKKGEELWKEFRRRQADKGSDEYTFITFMREVLSEAGHPVTLKEFDPDNDQWGPPVAHAMSHEYD
jgi:CspA family cold shock protein